MNLKKAILEAEDVKLVPVEMAEWGVTVYLRPLSAAQWDQQIGEVKNKFCGKIENMPNWRAHLVSRVLCDENGERIFEDNETKLLGKKSTAAIQKLFDKLAEINGMSEESEEELEKNSEETPADSSPSGLELT